jgi:putative sporulation protein YyaC
VNKNIHYIDALADASVLKLSEIFTHCVSEKRTHGNHIIILCIGTDRATGDSLGPLTGYKLRSSLVSQHVTIIGTLEKPVHAKNIQQTLEYITRVYDNPFIAAIDACLGKPESVGYITISEGPVSPGAGLSKDLPSVGHISITGIVNVASGMDFAVLQNTRLHLVMKMAEVIHDSIVIGLENILKKHSRSWENIV